MRRSLIRGTICAVAILVTLTTDLVPHHHDDWIDGASAGIGAREIHDADCRAPLSAVHLHADSVRHIDSCVACLRQHLQAIRTTALVRISQSVVCRLTSFTAAARLTAVNLSKSSRAPPPAQA
jgi:hypothetical protein